MEVYLRVAVGAIVWTLANAVYFDLRRKGIRGFGRFAAFWAGNPLTWLTLFSVKEGTVARFDPPRDDEDRLLREVRVDVELRGGLPASAVRRARELDEGPGR
jgi:hypothetical protein